MKEHKRKYYFKNKKSHNESYSSKIIDLQMLKEKEKDEIVKLQIEELIMFFKEIRSNW